MADYKEIKGKTVLSIASDLDNAAGEGQIWFNTTSGDFKTIQKVSGAWASGGNLNTARGKGFAVGTQTASLQVGGEGPPPGDVGNVEQYNGSTWSEIADLNTAREQMGGSGTTTSALMFGGQSPVVGVAESWNGTSWTEVADLNTARRGTTGAGASNTSALCSSGYDGTANVAVAETWDGSSWTEVGDVNTARRNHAGGGADSTSAMIMTGYDGSNSTVNCETWDGSSWTEIANVNAARDYAAGSPVGSGAGLVFGGTGVTAATEFFNGASWTEVSDLSTARQGVSGSGTTSLSLCSGGLKPPGTTLQTATEEWNQISTLAAGAWASGGNLPSSRALAATMGTQTATLIAKGYSESGTSPSSGGYFNNSLEYDGSSWGGSADLNRAHGSGLAAAGTQTAGLLAGGGEYVFPGSNTATEEVETYDGSSWTEIADINTERYDGACGGTQTAAILFGGYDPPLSPINMGNAETWNGSSWTEVADLNTARRRLMGSSIGTSTASLAVGGYTGYIASVETWDGSSWTEIADLNTARHSGGGCGTQTEAFAFGGWNGEAVPNCEEFDGSAWTEVADLSTNINGYGSGAGTQSLAIIAGGGPLPANPGTLGTEEWTKAQNIKTIAD